MHSSHAGKHRKKLHLAPSSPPSLHSGGRCWQDQELSFFCRTIACAGNPKKIICNTHSQFFRWQVCARFRRLATFFVLSQSNIAGAGNLKKKKSTRRRCIYICIYNPSSQRQVWARIRRLATFFVLQSNITRACAISSNLRGRCIYPSSPVAGVGQDQEGGDLFCSFADRVIMHVLEISKSTRRRCIYPSLSSGRCGMWLLSHYSIPFLV